ncbi:MAG: sulfatase [Prevotellaceae bacterium]|nr:sulfatase [Prevotellaceae bacterium]
MNKAFLLALIATPAVAKDKRPNVLIAIADDMSYPYCSAYGEKGVMTPGFDYVASSGVFFSNAYVCSPGSSPSRASILTGKYPWEIAEAGTHASSFPSEYLCFPDLLASTGYNIGFTGKGWGPGNWKVSGREHNPAGIEYNEKKLSPPHSGISTIDYTSNFIQFLDNTDKLQPFCFWYGSQEPHRPYSADAWEKESRSVDNLVVPPYLPDADVVRGDLANYIIEIEWFDKHLVQILDVLKERNLLENTIVIVTADNGMPFPHAKANCYDAGIHVPLAICWGNKIKHNQLETAIVSLLDLMPTLLDFIGINYQSLDMSGESLSPLLGLRKGKYQRESAFSGRERHSSARYNNWGYPIRSVRKGDYLLVRNFHPERWPAGNPLQKDDINLQRGFRDIDDSPTKQFLIQHHSDKKCQPFYQLSVGKRPEFELYDLSNDPGCMNNLASEEKYSVILEGMKLRLESELKMSHDPRCGGNQEIWESYPRLAGGNNLFNPD